MDIIQHLRNRLPVDNTRQRIIALISELRPRFTAGGCLLLTGPETADDTAALAGTVAEAAAALGYQRITIVDLRGDGRAGGSAPLVGRSAGERPEETDSSIEIFRPADNPTGDGNLPQFIRELRKSRDLMILVTDGVLTPTSRYGDPLTWTGLDAHVLLVCSEGSCLRDTVLAAAQRLRRGGLPAYGGIFLKTPGLPTLLGRLLGRTIDRTQVFPSSIASAGAEPEERRDEKTGRMNA